MKLFTTVTFVFSIFLFSTLSFAKEKYDDDLIYTVLYKSPDNLKKLLVKKYNQNIMNIALALAIHFKKEKMTEILLNNKAKIFSYWDYEWDTISYPITTNKVLNYEDHMTEDENYVEGDIDSANPVYTLLDLNPKLFEIALKNDRSWCNFKDYSQGKQDPEHLGPQWPIVNHLQGKGFRKAQPIHLKIYYKYCPKK